MIVLIVLIVLVVLYFLVIKKFKVIKNGSFVMVTGGVKTGKSTLSVYLARKELRSRVVKTKIKNFFRKIFNRDLIELPLLYSNVPLACPYVPVTADLLLRKTRFVFNSVIYLQEYSLVADSQLIKDMDVNHQLLLLNKLISHETHGGIMILDSQCLSDIHYSVKRCLSNYLYIHHLVMWVPFFLVAYVEELMYSDDNSTINVNDCDVETKLKKVIIPKKTWRYFDCYCYSVLTDDLPVEKNVVNNNLATKDLKARYILSIRDVLKNKNKKDGDFNA